MGEKSGARKEEEKRCAEGRRIEKKSGTGRRRQRKKDDMEKGHGIRTKKSRVERAWRKPWEKGSGKEGLRLTDIHGESRSQA